MNSSVRILKNSSVIQTLLFFKNHFIFILGLGLIAAFGRAIQLGAFGPVTSAVYIGLEVIIELSRILIFVYSLGLTNVKRGTTRIKQLIISRNAWKENWQIARQKLRKEWSSLLASFIIYLLIAFIINALIDYAAYQTCLYYKLKTNEIISDTASEWVIILFFKNISVIPLTLIFNALFLLWITNKTSSF